MKKKNRVEKCRKGRTRRGPRVKRGRETIIINHEEK